MEANQTKTYQDNNKWFSDVTQKMYFFFHRNFEFK